jgi:hypothetical protein
MFARLGSRSRFELVEDAFGFLDERGHGVGAGLKVQRIAPPVPRSWRIARAYIALLDDGITISRETANSRLERTEITARVLDGGCLRVVLRPPTGVGHDKVERESVGGNPVSGAASRHTL